MYNCVYFGAIKVSEKKAAVSASNVKHHDSLWTLYICQSTIQQVLINFYRFKSVYFNNYACKLSPSMIVGTDAKDLKETNSTNCC